MVPEGLLPKCILVLGSLAFYNALQNFIPSMRLIRRIYAREPHQATPLMARMMGTWTFTSGLIRVYTAYNISNPVLYQLCLWTFGVALASFTSEVFVFKTAPLSSPGVYPALIMSSVMLSWMLSSYASYVVPISPY